jgi:UDP-N-acetyl-alpha-D-muramoyl-L-alanyl-L-glutamate epimerase
MNSPGDFNATVPPRGKVFRYAGFSTDAERGLLTCHYSLDGREFTERVTLAPGAAWDTPAAQAAARLVYLLAGVSYYKTAAPPVIDLGDTALTEPEHAFLSEFYQAGLGEYAYRNGLDLSGLRLGATPAVTPEGTPDSASSQPSSQSSSQSPSDQLRPLIPFGGGIDSIVTVEGVRQRTDDIALFVVNRSGDRFAAIEKPAAVSGLPVIRAGREIDPQLLRSKELGFRNGHVPVTGIISAIAVLAAVLGGRNAVVMSNEWSASVPTLEHDGRQINHQWSKSAAFEAAFRDLLRAGPGLPDYFSALRDRTELWVGERFANLTQYHGTFRSCNRAFHIDTARRLDHWCGQCDKCCFIDLILSPFMSKNQLEAVFKADGGGGEPLGDPGLRPKFETLLGAGTKPFECVGEVNECRAATVLAAQRPDRSGSPDPTGRPDRSGLPDPTDPTDPTDRSGTPLLQALAAEITARPDAPTQADIAAMRRPVGASFVPAAYAFEDA